MGSSDWQQWLYIAACVIVPATWGAVTAWLFSRLDRRRARRDQAAREIDYMI